MQYRVISRRPVTVDGKTYAPGDVVKDPDRASLLVRRGVVTPVEAATEPTPKATAKRRSTKDTSSVAPSAEEVQAPDAAPPEASAKGGANSPRTSGKG